MNKKLDLVNKEHTNINKYKSKNPIQKFLIKNYYKQLVLLVKHISPKYILDAGCGEGFALDRLQKEKLGEKLKGVDFSKESIRIGKLLFPNLKIDHGSIYNLSFKNNEFDLTLCTEVLEHLENPPLALKELRRISKKYILISVPHEPFFMISNFFRGKDILHFGNNPEHINHWSFFSFKKFLTDNHLKVITVKLLFPWILVLCSKQ